MRKSYLVAIMWLVACSNNSNSEHPGPRVPAADKEDETKIDEMVDPPKPADQTTSMPPITAANPAPVTPAEPAKPAPAATPAPAAPTEFVVDPDTLSFPVVFHTGGSKVWTEDKLKAVVAEAQRILAQAKIEILPSYTTSMTTTDNLDVYFVPQIPDNPGVNGISFMNQPLEVYVIDNVGLNKVDDKRPAEVSVPRYFKGAKPTDKVAVNGEEAEEGRTTAHEIGHQLGLPHRQATTNLLASGTTGWTLNEAEIAIVRKTAVDKFKAKFVKTLP